MSLWDNVKKFAQPYADDDYDDYDEDDEYADEYEQPAEPPARRAPRRAPAPAPAPVPAAPVAQEQPAQADDTLIAVISAAVAAMMEDGSAFTVRRIRRVSNATAWSRAGREEQVYSRF